MFTEQTFATNMLAVEFLIPMAAYRLLSFSLVHGTIALMQIARLGQTIVAPNITKDIADSGLHLRHLPPNNGGSSPPANGKFDKMYSIVDRRKTRI
jgi:hypothetical protein